MAKSIPIQTNPVAPGIEVDAAVLADAFGMELAAFRQLMNDRKITVLCERGTGEDQGLYRASFYYERVRVRLVVDGSGTPVTPVERSSVGA
jgi:hypothetical protein